MTKIKKRSGRKEEFKREKLQRSIKKAGAKEDTARKVARKITPNEGMATSEIKRKVATELENHDKKLAKSYKDYKKSK